MSKDQQVQAVRVANVPEDEFEEAVESEAAVTKLAGMGRVGTQQRSYIIPLGGWKKSWPSPGKNLKIKKSGSKKTLEGLGILKK